MPWNVFSLLLLLSCAVLSSAQLPDKSPHSDNNNKPWLPASGRHYYTRALPINSGQHDEDTIHTDYVDYDDEWDEAHEDSPMEDLLRNKPPKGKKLVDWPSIGSDDGSSAVAARAKVNDRAMAHEGNIKVASSKISLSQYLMVIVGSILLLGLFIFIGLIANEWIRSEGRGELTLKKRASGDTTTTTSTPATGQKKVATESTNLSSNKKSVPLTV